MKEIYGDVHFKLGTLTRSSPYYVEINHVSCLLWIDEQGMERATTGYPQKGVDYDHNRPIIIGVDIDG